ncbi:MAG: hypothetical protein JO250_11105 [Armatimonadetes bacterium]|nr:hypothetical protein [Armatimonadota bacterium]
MPNERIPTVRISPDNASVLKSLGGLQELAGSWRGRGFNLIARPDFEDKSNLYLQLNQTRETLKIDPIGSAIPNRGFGQDDIELFGLTYLQKISDAATGGALHIEPGIWITQPTTSYPPEAAPKGDQLIARMGTIPHGNSLLAQGICESFKGAPTLKTATAEYNGSAFPSFNSTPFATLPTAPPVISAAGSSEKATALAAGVPSFPQYDIANAAGAIVPNAGIPTAGSPNTRTPYKTSPVEPPLPVNINGVPMQDVVNDPITLLQAVIHQQVADGHTFEGTALNIATQASIAFSPNANNTPAAPPVAVKPPNGAGGTENILFLEGGDPVGAKGPNADTALVYATFWLEKVSHKDRPSFMQLQYAQLVVLDFEILTTLPPTAPPGVSPVNLGWPHISVATLTKTFN